MRISPNPCPRVYQALGETTRELGESRGIEAAVGCWLVLALGFRFPDHGFTPSKVP